MMDKISVIGVPSSAGARKTGQDLGPEWIRKAGLIERLKSSGMEVKDFGDLPHVRYSRDEECPNPQNVFLVGAVIRQLSARIARAVFSGYKPFILGGDCTITIGAIAGMLKLYPDLALVYFDGDIDMNTPEDSPSGILDGMVLSHLIGHGSPELSHAGDRFPLLAEKDIVAFGYNQRSGYMDPGELERFKVNAIHKFPADRISGNASSEASNVLEVLGAPQRPFLLHFDVDVLDESEFPVADVLHSYGLSLVEAQAALRVFLQSPACAGFVMTEFNAERDPEEIFSRKIVDLIVASIR
jgi:arginase